MTVDEEPAPRLRRARRGAACAAAIGLIGLAGVDAPGPAPSRPQAAPVEHAADATHQYRVFGKIRLLVAWVGVADIGGARLSRHGAGHDRALTLLIGSDPTRAPGATNQWGYAREEVDGAAASVFIIRTSASSGDADRTHPGAGQGGLELSVLCSRVSDTSAASRTASVRTDRGVTYGQVSRAIDAAECAPRWHGAIVDRPAGVEPGMLNALDRVMRSCVASARQAASPRCDSVAYIYNDAIYDLVTRRVERVAERRTPAGLFRDLIRIECTIRNRTTGWSDEFAVTFPTTGAMAGVPIAAQYQPGWWFRIELELDDERDVPPDSSGDDESLRRIAALCHP
jgi:hypothetical protein